MADVDTNLYQWSTTEASNKPTGGTAISTGLDDNLRRIQATTRAWLATKGSDIASASTTDLGAVEGLFHDITGTTTITGFGTVSAGIWKIVKFEGALTLTHNATSLILLTGANRTTVVGDVGIYISEGSGNWRELSYSQAASQGTWTPTLAGDSTAGTQTYSQQTGKWTKFGDRLVHIEFAIVLTAKDAATAGNMRVEGVPFAFSSSANHGAVAVGHFSNINLSAGYSQLTLVGTASGSVIRLLENGDNVSAQDVGAAAIANTTAFSGSGIYSI